MRKTIIPPVAILWFLVIVLSACSAPAGQPPAVQVPPDKTNLPPVPSRLPQRSPSATSMQPADQNGTRLANFLNNLHVEDYWAKGQYVDWETGTTVAGPISHWATDKATHCSGFVSAVAAILAVPILHPPFPSGSEAGVTYTSLFANGYGRRYGELMAASDSLLADKQASWLENIARAAIPSSPYTTADPSDWVQVNAYQAQTYANQGYLAVAAYKSDNPSTPGHIAVIAPAQPGAALGNYPDKNVPYTSLEVDGPFEAQSGGFNSSYTTISRGFAPPNGPSDQWFGADSNKNTIKFFVYFMPIDWSAVIIPPAVK